MSKEIRAEPLREAAVAVAMGQVIFSASQALVEVTNVLRTWQVKVTGMQKDQNKLTKNGKGSMAVEATFF